MKDSSRSTHLVYIENMDTNKGELIMILIVSEFDNSVNNFTIKILFICQIIHNLLINRLHNTSIIIICIFSIYLISGQLFIYI